MSNQKKYYDHDSDIEQKEAIKFLSELNHIEKNGNMLNIGDTNEVINYFKGAKSNRQMQSFTTQLQSSKKNTISLESIPNIKKIGAFAKPYCNDMFIEYSSQSDNEKLIHYNCDGYKSVYIGQILSDRYIVLEKLGWGNYSTVWLCKDCKRDTYIALKIFKGSPFYLEKGFCEIEILQRINRVSQDMNWLDFVKNIKQKKTPNKDDCHVISILNAVIEVEEIKQRKQKVLKNQNLCVSLEVLGESLYTLLAKTDWKGLPLNVVRKITKQILISLVFLHDYCKVAHCDLRPQNILLKLNQNQKKNIKEYKTLRNFKKYKERLEYQRIQIKKIQLDEDQYNKSDSSCDIVLSKRGKIDDNYTIDTNEIQQNKLILTEDDFKYEFERQITQKQITDQKKKKALKKKLRKKMKKNQQNLKNEELNFNAVDFDNQTQNIMHKRSIIKHGNFKFDVNKDIDKNLEIKLIDFSTSCYIDNIQNKNSQNFQKYQKIQKRQYRAPEILLEKHFDEKIDIWSLGCIIFEMITGEYLFNPQKDNKDKKVETRNHIEQIQEFIGIFPNHLDPFDIIKDKNLKSIEIKEQFIKSQKFKFSLEQMLVRFFQWQPKEARRLGNFLKRFLQIDPSKRSSAIDLLKDPWLNDQNENIYATREEINQYFEQLEKHQNFQYLNDQFQEEDFYAEESCSLQCSQDADSREYRDFYEQELKDIDTSFKQRYSSQNDLSDFKPQDNTANWFFDQKLFKQLQ